MELVAREVRHFAAMPCCSRCTAIASRSTPATCAAPIWARLTSSPCLDVLHYIPHAEQELLLDRVRAALGSGGLLPTRVKRMPRAAGVFVSQWIDCRIAALQATALPAHLVPPAERVAAHVLNPWFYRRSAADEQRGTPFANVMLICREVMQALCLTAYT